MQGSGGPWQRPLLASHPRLALACTGIEPQRNSRFDLRELTLNADAGVATRARAAEPGVCSVAERGTAEDAGVSLASAPLASNRPAPGAS